MNTAKTLQALLYPIRHFTLHLKRVFPYEPLRMFS